MEEVRVKHLGDVKFEAVARGHRVFCDQPAVNGGADTAMTPPEYLLASLGTCAGFYAVHYLKARSLSVESLEIRVTAEKVKNPGRMDSFRIEVMAPGLPEAHEAGLARVVRSCLIHTTMLNEPSIETVVHTSVPSAV